MKTGMLWFDDDEKRTLYEKVQRAANRFREKYGRSPDLCYGNPVTITEQTSIVTAEYKIMLKQARSILPNHFWLGIEGES